MSLLAGLDAHAQRLAGTTIAGLVESDPARARDFALRLGPLLTARPASAVKVMTTPMRSLNTPAMVRKLRPEGWGSVFSISVIVVVVGSTCLNRAWCHSKPDSGRPRARCLSIWARGNCV